MTHAVAMALCGTEWPMYISASFVQMSFDYAHDIRILAKRKAIVYTSSISNNGYQFSNQPFHEEIFVIDKHFNCIMKANQLSGFNN